jgi:carbon storage regulator
VPIITRKAGERIMIGEDVVLRVIEVAGGTVRLGIEAPRSLSIYREEIWNALRGDAQVSASAELPAAPTA